MNSDYRLSAILVLPIKCDDHVLFIQRNASFSAMPFVGLELEGAGLPLGDGRQAVPVIHDMAYDLDDDSLSCTLNDSAVPDCETVDEAFKKYTGRNSRWTIGEVIDAADYCPQQPEVAVDPPKPTTPNADAIAAIAGPIASHLLSRFLPPDADRAQLYSAMSQYAKHDDEICVRAIGELDVVASASVNLAQRIVKVAQNGLKKYEEAVAEAYEE